MNNISRIALAIYTMSLVLAILTAVFGRGDWSTWLGAPAVALSALATVGHFVTLDEDVPGGFGNPYGDQLFWEDSLRELKYKFVALIVAGAVVCIPLF